MAHPTALFLPAGKMAVLDTGGTTAEQLQAIKQHPALKQAFTVYVSRQAALQATLAGSPESEQQLASLAASQEAFMAVDGLVQVGRSAVDPRKMHGAWCLTSLHQAFQTQR